jgi:ABC-type sugar transport system substrate-binding protein
MDRLNVILSLITRDNDFQAEQAASATAVAASMGVKLQILYADNDAVNQTQQLVTMIQDVDRRPHAIIVEPVGTEMVQVARAAVAAGIGWGVLNREPDYLTMLRGISKVPVCAVTTDQEEIGRIQGKQLAALVNEGNVLYIEGPSNSTVAQLRTKGMLSTKPDKVVAKTLKGDWTEHSAHQSVNHWLALSTSRQLHIGAVICQNDAMAMGARKALLDRTEMDREQWKNIPFTGCDGLPRTGQEWVRRGMLRATIIAKPSAGVALAMFANALRSHAMPQERTLLDPISFPTLAELSTKPPTVCSK